MRRQLWQRLVIWYGLRYNRWPKSWYDASDVTWASMTGRHNRRPWNTELVVDNDYGGSDLPIPRHGGDVTILPDPDFKLDGIERLRKRLGR